MRRGLAAAALIALTFALATPALACGCDSKPLAVLIDEADAVFSVAPLDESEIVTPGPMQMEVNRVYKGEVGSTVDVWATEGPAACGIATNDEGAVGLLASESGGKTRIGTCLPPYSIADIEEILGPGHEPAATLALAAAPSLLLYAAGAVVLAAIAATFLLVRRRSRTP
jgi:hypothetical protein